MRYPRDEMKDLKYGPPRTVWGYEKATETYFGGEIEKRRVERHCTDRRVWKWPTHR